MPGGVVVGHLWVDPIALEEKLRAKAAEELIVATWGWRALGFLLLIKCPTLREPLSCSDQGLGPGCDWTENPNQGLMPPTLPWDRRYYRAAPDTGFEIQLVKKSRSNGVWFAVKPDKSLCMANLRLRATITTKPINNVQYLNSIINNKKNPQN